MVTTATASDQALILHTLPYSDNDLIVTLFGQRTGRINAFARNGRTSKKRFGSGLVAGARIDLFLNPPAGESELWRLKEICHLQQWPWMAPEEVRLPIKLGGAYILDVIKTFTPPGAPDPELYQLAGLAMEHIHNTPDVVEFSCRFQVRLLQLYGICPDFMTCGRCGNELDTSSCWPYGDEIVGPCCRRLLPVDQLAECPLPARLALITLVTGHRPTPHTLDLHSLALTRALLAYHFNRQLKSADLFEKIIGNNHG